jgi:hypothetical protein
MNLPSIKLNIFKKLEYFLVLEKLNSQFEGQFQALIKREFKNDKFDGVYPTWEVEKKFYFGHIHFINI